MSNEQTVIFLIGFLQGLYGKLTDEDKKSCDAIFEMIRADEIVKKAYSNMGEIKLSQDPF